MSKPKNDCSKSKLTDASKQAWLNYLTIFLAIFIGTSITRYSVPLAILSLLVCVIVIFRFNGKTADSTHGFSGLRWPKYLAVALGVFAGRLLTDFSFSIAMCFVLILIIVILLLTKK
ncbi:MAG: hypothetical protein FWC50_06840 [Planctomycetaceae bacterium]|nr:hypothetical protein [Planctomycetaceae bacterium]